MLLKTDAILQPRQELMRALGSVLLDARFDAVKDLLESDRRPESSPLHDLSGVTVRFGKVHVIDAHARFAWDLAADVYPILALVTGAGPDPVEIRTLGITGDVKDGSDLPIGRGAGWDIDRTFDRTPTFLDLHVLLMRSQQGIRDPAAQLAAALDRAPARDLAAALHAAATAPSPPPGTVVTAATALLGVVAGALARDKDEPIFYGVASFEDDPEDLGIGRTWRLTDHANARIDFEILPRQA